MKALAPFMYHLDPRIQNFISGLGTPTEYKEYKPEQYKEIQINIEKMVDIFVLENNDQMDSISEAHLYSSLKWFYGLI
jgi:hypothetical protein